MTKYKTFDGIEFDDELEYNKYQKSAYYVLNSKVQKLMSRTKFSDCELFNNIGFSNTEIYIIKLNNESDKDTVLQWYILMQSLYNNQILINKYRDILDKAYENKDIIILSKIRNEEFYYIVDSKINIINKLNSLLKDENLCDK